MMKLLTALEGMSLQRRQITDESTNMENSSKPEIPFEHFAYNCYFLLTDSRLVHLFRIHLPFLAFGLAFLHSV